MASCDTLRVHQCQFYHLDAPWRFSSSKRCHMSDKITARDRMHKGISIELYHSSSMLMRDIDMGFLSTPP